MLVRDVAAQAPDREVLAKGPSLKAGLGADGTAVAGAARLRQEAGRGGREARAHPRRQAGSVRVPLGRERRAARRDARGARRGRAEEAADPEDDALGRPRRGVRASGARPGDAARRPRRAGDRARPIERPHDARPPVPGQGRDRDRARRRLRGAARARRQGDRELRAARAQDARAARRPPRAAASIAAEECALRRGDRAGRVAGGVRGAFREGVPRRAAGMPDAHDAAEPEVLPARRRPRASSLNRFLIVSQHGDSPHPQHIVHGNERVLRARLADAKFFYDQDRQDATLADARAAARERGRIHNKLGSQLERVERIEQLAGDQSRATLGEDEAGDAERAARLCQGRPRSPAWSASSPSCRASWARTTRGTTASREAVAGAIEAHYRPRFAGDALPETRDRRVRRARRQARHARRPVRHRAAADRRQGSVRPAPRGARRDPDPRRERLPLSHRSSWSDAAFAAYPVGDASAAAHADVRRRSSSSACAATCATRATRANEVEAVLCHAARRASIWCRGSSPRCARSRSLPEAESLAAANKRVANILRQAAAKGESFGTPTRSSLQEPQERELFDALSRRVRATRPRASSRATTPAT